MVILGLSALDARLKGPVAGSRRLEGMRDKKGEALAGRAFLNSQLALASMIRSTSSSMPAATIYGSS